MPLSPADFYYYSQATGAPLADTPEKRAQQAPEVYRYRQQELQAPKKGPSALDVLGVGAALAGVAAGGYGLARALSRRPPTEIKVTAPPRPFTQATAAEAADLRRAAAGAAEPPPSRTPVSQPSVVRAIEPDPWEGATATRQRSAEEFVRQARQERPQGVVITKLLPVTQTRTAPTTANIPFEFLLDPQTGEAAKTSAQPAFTSTQKHLADYLGLTGRMGTAVETQESNLPQVINQSLNAVDTAEDQMTGRIKQQLQRNEDLDMSQVELMEEVADYNYQQAMEQDEPDAPINQVAAQLPDGPPVDQAEGMLQRVVSSGMKEGIDLRTGQRFSLITQKPRVGLGPGQNIEFETSPTSLVGTEMFNFLRQEREKIAQDFLDRRGTSPTTLDVERELSKRLGKKAFTYGPEYSARRQALELIAQTGNPKVAENVTLFGLSPVTFETFENMPAAKQELFEKSAPMSLAGYPDEELISVVPQTGVEITLPGIGEKADISTLRKPVITENTAIAAEEYVQRKREANQYWLDNIKKEVQPQLDEIYDQRRVMIQNKALELKAKQANAQAIGNTALSDKLEEQINILRYQYQNPQSDPPRLFPSPWLLHRRNESNRLEKRIFRAEETAAKTEANIKRKYPTTLSDWSGEAGRVFGELDVNTGEFIPETMEVRSERRTADLPSKGGGGRNVAEYAGGEILDEEVRRIQGGGRIRDYDETGAPVQHWKGDETQTGRVIGIYGISPSDEKGDLPSLRPSEPRYTAQEIVAEALRMAKASQEGDVPIPSEKAAVIQSLGSQPSTPESRASVLMSEAIKKANRFASERNPQGGKIPGPINLTRRALANISDLEPEFLPENKIKVRGLGYERQGTLPGITGYAARQIKSEADIAAEQLAQYMSKLQKERSVPSAPSIVIQPTLF